jgi:AcrR family transcriptional regulator
MSAAERREAVLRAARIEFGAGGYAGTGTESIARRAGVSQPYLFRLFPSKKALFLATVDRCFDDLGELFERAAGGRTGVS